MSSGMWRALPRSHGFPLLNVICAHWLKSSAYLVDNATGPAMTNGGGLSTRIRHLWELDQLALTEAGVSMLARSIWTGQRTNTLLMLSILISDAPIRIQMPPCMGS
jgi:hypothetical protein